MMKKALLLLLIFVFCLSSAYAEDNVWVEETWERIDREVDCDGLPLLIHARVLDVPDGTEACEYHLDKLSDDDLVEKGKQINWPALGLDMSHGKWRLPDKIGHDYTFVSEPEIYPNCTLFSYLQFVMINRSQLYQNTYTVREYINSDDAEIKGISNEQIKAYAETVATECGFQLGNILRVYKCDDAKTVQANMITIAKDYGKRTDIDLETATEYTFTDVIYPVYFNGLRLYSGERTYTQDEREILNMNMRMAVTAGHGILAVEGPIIDSDHMKVVTEMKPVISAEDALRCMEEKYSGFYHPQLKSVTVQELALEYVLVPSDPSAEKGYTVYPAWVAQTYEKWRNESGELWYWVGYEAYDARTGEEIF